MAQLQVLENPFQFETLDVRTAVDEKNDVWFCAKDVCATLDINWNGSDTLENMPENWKGVWKLHTPGGEQDAIFINEAGLYRLIFRSNKPKAEEFANWVCEEVLPQIRKNGYFGKVSAKEHRAIRSKITILITKLHKIKDAMALRETWNEITDLCDLIGRDYPDLSLLGKDITQAALPGFDVQPVD